MRDLWRQALYLTLLLASGAAPSWTQSVSRPASAPLQNPAQLQAELRQVQQWEILGKYEEAFAGYRALFLRMPAPQYLEGALRCLRALKDDARLLEFLQEALQVSPGNPDALCELASVRFRQGAREEALQVWRGLVSRPGAEAGLYGRVASAMLEAGLRDEAISLYREARARFGDPSLFVFELANLYLAQGDYRAATQEYVSFLRANPESYSFVESSLAAYLKTSKEGGEKEIVEELRKAVASDPTNPGLHAVLGGVLIRLGRFGEALPEQQKAEELQAAGRTRPAAPFGQHLLRLAEAAYRDGDLQTARLAFEAILAKGEKSPYAARARLGLAEVLVAEGEVERALQSYLEYARTNPNSPEAPQALYRAATLLKGPLGRPDSARTLAAQVVNRYPMHPTGIEAGLLLAEIDWMTGDWRGADSTLRKVALVAESRWPELAERARFELALLAFYRSQWDTAMVLLEGLASPQHADRGEGSFANDAIELLWLIRAGTAADPEGLRHIARARQAVRRGNPDSAVAQLRRYLEANPHSPLTDRLWFELALAAETGGKPRLAAEAYRTILESFPSSLLADQAAYRLGTCLEAAGDVEGAQAAYELLLTNYPQSVYLEPARNRIRVLRRRS